MNTKISKLVSLLLFSFSLNATTAQLNTGDDPQSHLLAPIKTHELGFIYQRSLEGPHEMTPIEFNPYIYAFPCPSVHSYDLFGFGSQVSFCAMLSPDHLFSVQSLSQSTAGIRETYLGTTNGGISCGQEEPLGFKPQYVYLEHALKGVWHNQPQTIDGRVITPTSYIVEGTTNNNLTIYEGSEKRIYPTATSPVCIHDNEAGGSLLSGDCLHLYKDPNNPPTRVYNENEPYTLDDYNKLIFGNDNKTRAIVYSTSFNNDWKLTINSGEFEKALPQKPDVTGLILLLNNEDFGHWDRACDKSTTLWEALNELSIIKENAEVRQILSME